MQNYKIKDDKIEFNLPESWGEVTIAQYRKLLDVNETPYPDIETVSIMSGIDSDFWKTYENYPFFGQLLSSLDFLRTPPNFEGVPKYFDYGECRFAIPEEPFFGSVAQYEDMKVIAQTIQKSKDSVKELMSSYSLIARTFLYPIVSGKKYDYQEIAKAQEECESKLDIVTAMQTTAFFLKRLSALNFGTKVKSNLTRSKKLVRTIPKRIGQALKFW